MEVQESVEGTADVQPYRRAHPRFAVDGDASLLVVKHGSSVACRVVDLSMEGCRVQTRERFLAGIQMRVEVSFKVRGLAFRFCGVTRWTDGQSVVGIRFADMTCRRKEELAEILGEVEEETAAKAAKEAAEELAAAESARLQAEEQAAEQARLAAAEAAEREAVLPEAPEQPAAPELTTEGCALPVVGEGGGNGQETGARAGGAADSLVQESGVVAAPAAPVRPRKRERRAQSRHGVDTSAVIYLVNVGCRLSGRILDLSGGGCRIRTNERFPVGIYTRVETEFRLEGLPFRLGGVIQAIHDRHNVGIRFLDMSERKREQLDQLIAEIEEMRAMQRLALPEGQAEGA
jgi:hypothetical protein